MADRRKRGRAAPHVSVPHDDEELTRGEKRFFFAIGFFGVVLALGVCYLLSNGIGR